MPRHEIVFWSSVFFILGIFLASASPSTTVALFVIALLVTIGGIWALLVHSRGALWICILPLLAIAGIFYYQYDTTRSSSRVNIPFEKQTEFNGIISRNPKHGLEYQEIVISLSQPLAGNILVRLPRYPQFEYGDLISFSGKIVKPKPYEYAQYLEKERVEGVSYTPRADLKEKNHGSKIRAQLFKIKNAFIQHYEKVLPANHSALLAGLTLGEQSGFTDTIKNALKASGTLHIVALSGYNISILAWVIARTLGRFLKRNMAFVVTVFMIIGFVIMTGAEASAVRAGIMGLLILIAERSGRIYSMRNALALTALLMILANPKILVFDIGFQLSFAALLGIVYLKPAIELFIRHAQEPSILNWRENLITTTSAQVAVIPILLHSFGNFSLIAPISNLLVLETVPLVMGFGFLVGVAGFVSYYLSLVLAWLTHLMLSYQIFVITFTAKIGGSLLIGQVVSNAILLAYYALIIGFIFYAHKRHAPPTRN